MYAFINLYSYLYFIYLKIHVFIYACMYLFDCQFSIINEKRKEISQAIDQNKQKPYVSDNRNHIFGFRNIHINIIILKLVI